MASQAPTETAPAETAPATTTNRVRSPRRNSPSSNGNGTADPDEAGLANVGIVVIDADNNIVVTYPIAEMGQGTITGLAQLVAEELDFVQINYSLAERDAEKRDPLQALCGWPGLLRSMSWMLEAAGLDASGIRGALRAKGLALVWLSSLRTFLTDSSEDLSATMAALDVWVPGDIAPSVKVQAIVRYAGRDVGTSVFGIDPRREGLVSDLPKQMRGAPLTALYRATNAIVIGDRLAEKIGARIGANITVQTSQGASIGAHVVGFFHTGVRQIDEGTAYTLTRNFVRTLAAEIERRGQTFAAAAE